MVIRTFILFRAIPRMTTFTDITRKSSIPRTPELNWLFEEWAEVLYGNALVKTFNNALEQRQQTSTALHA